MKWILAVLCAAVAATPALAQQKQSKPSTTLKKCVDEQGVTQYYDKNPPPGCKDKEITEMSTKGVTKKTIAAPPTEEEKKSRADDAARKVDEAVGGAFLGSFGWLMWRQPLVPVGDPRLAESLAFENV